MGARVRFKVVRATLLTLLALGVLLLIVLLLNGSNFAVLNPQGTIAVQERKLMIFAALLSLLVVVPVFALTFGIVWRYRESNTTARYTPDWDHNRVAETIWWLLPTALIAVLAVVTWRSSHQLDPYRPLATSEQPITIQVVALEWKWLFIYPEQGIATVNQVSFPAGRPINFEITSDAPMNSFWIPQLGGQVYAMSGMSTQLHLQADHPGAYRGSSANLSGAGFAGMKFTATSTTQVKFDQWVQQARNGGGGLTMANYKKLAQPSESMAPRTYASTDNDLYNQVIMQYMSPMTIAETAHVR